jgi:hypothetical protein
MSKTKDQAVQDLRSILHHLQLAAEDARAQGTVGLAIIATQPDGSGQITCRLAAPEFLADLALALDAEPPTADQILDAKARQFLDKHGL